MGRSPVEERRNRKMGILPPLTHLTAEDDPEEREMAWYARLAELRRQHETTQLDAQGVAPGRWVQLRRAEAIPLGHSPLVSTERGKISSTALPSPLEQALADPAQQALESLVGHQGQIVEVIYIKHYLESVPFVLRLRFPSHPNDIFDVWVDCVEIQPEAISPDKEFPHP